MKRGKHYYVVSGMCPHNQPRKYEYKTQKLQEVS